MNKVADEIASYLGSAQMTDEEFIQHYGMPRRSGRYPWGSGKDPYQSGADMLGRIEELKKKGWKETTKNIKKEFNMNSSDYRKMKSIAMDERRILLVNRAKSLREEGKGASEIARIMGVKNESTVRGWFNAEAESRMLKSRETADFLKKRVDEKRMIDVGKGIEHELGISKDKLETALFMLKREGYNVYKNTVDQLSSVSNQRTINKYLCAPDVQYKEIYELDKIGTINEYTSRDLGETYHKKFTYPTSLDSKRLMIRYKDDVGSDGVAGIQKDGIIELRRGVDDLSLGEAKYSQVRILVDGTHYIKGMALYSDNMPDGVDVVFNTNKSKDIPMKKVLKEIKDDPDNPFGSAIKDADQGGQYWYKDKKTGEEKLGLINKRANEGDWSEWKDTLPSQFLGKQSKELARKQLGIAKADKEAELDEILSLTNSTIKQHYLKKFADGCDKAAIDLKAAALPGQKYHVIIPINAMGDNKVFAPKYEDGTKLALVRYPHGGIFEIPILTVDNKNPVAKKLLGTDVEDAIGITAKVAEQLSGADFDGDTVMCIPTHDRRGKVHINNKKPLKDLDGFDPKFEYGTEERINSKGEKEYYRNGRKVSILKATDMEMGKISNLITDMTLGGANDNDIARAVKHSMVVIDAAKHKLDYQQSYIDNNIAALKNEWQIKYDEDGNIKYGGASTILSRAKSPYNVPKRKGEGHINVEFNANGKRNPYYDPTKPKGSLIYTTAPDEERYYPDDSYNKKTGIKKIQVVGGKPIEYSVSDPVARDKYEPVMRKNKKTGEVYFTNKDGSIKYRTKERTVELKSMAAVDNAKQFMSKNRHQIEKIYADYANSMKALANKARIELINTPNLEYDANANKVYKEEVKSLTDKLVEAQKNAARERAAGRLASMNVKRELERNPEMSKDDKKKLKQRSLTKYREEVGTLSRRERSFDITDKEWEAIQAGAISNNKLKDILSNVDIDALRSRAMPKAGKTLNTAQINRIKAMSASHTLKQIADKMGLSPTTVSKYLKGDI